MAESTTFVDQATLFVKGGDGGSGVTSFLREKFRPNGGPDGGSGGNGGSVILRADTNIGTLSDLARHPHQRAGRGAHGMGRNKHGANADDLIKLVPEGTAIYDAESGEQIADLVRSGAEAVVAAGGKGGRGNASLASARRRAPGFSELGEEGVERRLRLELRVLADVGLVGLPNAGKSSLIARLSAARPKVAAYPFTTLTPHLGVADDGDERFVVADLPGLIEGAAEGRGLGHAFLRHLARCLVMCFVIDSADEDPAAALLALRAELTAYDPSMIARPAVIVANKSDLPGATEGVEALQEAAYDTPLLVCSALAGDGIPDLVDALSGAVEKARATHEAALSVKGRTIIKIEPESFRAEVVRENEAFRIVSAKAERLVARFDLNNDEAVAYLQERFKSLGVESALTKAGAVEGDEVRIGHAVFEFLPEHSG